MLSLVGAYILSLALCLLLERKAHRLGLMDLPGARKLQTQPVPRAGGLAILAATTVAAFGALSTVPWMILAGALLIYAGGLYDDLRPQNTVAKKLAFQVAGAALGAITIYMQTSSPALTVISFFGLLGLTNAFNLMDNMNGLTAGLSLVLALGLYALGWVPEAEALAFVGALLGFLTRNFPRGKIFLGDQGSQLLGFWLTVRAMQGAANFALARTSLVPVTLCAILFVLFFPFVFDTTLVVIIRKLEGRPIMSGDNNHVSHQLRRLGLSPVMVAGFLFSIEAACVVTCCVWGRATGFAF